MDMQPSAETSTLPPLQPNYVLRGHSAQIHSACFLRQNSRLLTGDADGWVVLWNVASKRPAAVWKPHSSAILALGTWGADRIITHGRDSKLNVWLLRESEELGLSQTLPIEDAASERKEPWLLHSLMVNALNFCAFAQCTATDDRNELLIAVPGTEEGSISIYSLPDERHVSAIPVPADTKSGMLMALSIFHKEGILHVIAGYEIGQTNIWQQDRHGQWHSIYAAKAHTQPILSLDVSPDRAYYFTSGADAIIARHSLDSTSSSDSKQVRSKHSGQQSLKVRSDGRIFGTAGWDGRLRVYSSKTIQELAVLKWHKEGCYALAFAEIDPQSVRDGIRAEDTAAPETQAITTKQTPVSQRRSQKTQSTHWLAAGAKDGKVSLWQVY